MALLSAYFDGDGHAGKSGVLLSTKSEEMSKLVQLLLLNFGIVSNRARAADGCYRVHLTGRAAREFQERISFGLTRKREALARYVSERRWFKPETCTDEVVAIECGRKEVYGMTVATTHCYAAAGFINHNSFWHRELINSLKLPQELHLEFLVRHNQVLRPVPGDSGPQKT